MFSNKYKTPGLLYVPANLNVVPLGAPDLLGVIQYPYLPSAVTNFASFLPPTVDIKDLLTLTVDGAAACTTAKLDPNTKKAVRKTNNFFIKFTIFIFYSPSQIVLYYNIKSIKCQDIRKEYLYYPSSKYFFAFSKSSKVVTFIFE